LAKKYAKNALIIIVKGNIEKADKEINTQTYKADKLLLKAYKVKCLPTVYIQRGEVYQKIEIAFKGEK